MRILDYSAYPDRSGGRIGNDRNDRVLPVFHGKDRRCGKGNGGNGGKPGATAYINQPGAQQIDGYAGEGVSNPGFDTDNHPFDGQCAEVMCASKVVTAIENGEDGWGVGKPAYIHVDQVRFKGPCPGCEDVLYQLASYLDAPVQLSFDGGPGFGTITLPPFLPGLVPFGG